MNRRHDPHVTLGVDVQRRALPASDGSGTRLVSRTRDTDWRVDVPDDREERREPDQGPAWFDPADRKDERFSELAT